ncbi:DUF222 domain-containing protein [Georgenia sp. SUBG003]|uniref:DUF222 domain-containing protein n=1 Tax=Georgenia sp. SUBG003 TaxID=1497974 RepID=UPI003AB5826F
MRELTDRQGTSARAADRAAAEIAARLGSTNAVGAAKVNLAAALDSFPEVADALSTGRIDSRKATVLTTREPGLTARQHRRVVTGLLRDADRLSGPRLRNRIRAAALSVNPEAGAARRRAEHAARKVTITPAPDAMAWITAYVRADHAHTVKAALGALARAATDGTGPGEDERTRAQVQADAFVDLFATVLDRGVDLAGHPLPTGTRGRAGGADEAFGFVCRIVSCEEGCRYAEAVRRRGEGARGADGQGAGPGVRVDHQGVRGGRGASGDVPGDVARVGASGRCRRRRRDGDGRRRNARRSRPSRRGCGA